MKPLAQPFHGAYIPDHDVAQHSHNLYMHSVSATMTDLQSRATVGEHRGLSFSLLGKFLMVPRMCLVEVERSPKPVASWYVSSF